MPAGQTGDGGKAKGVRMIPKYTIEYSLSSLRNQVPNHYGTDDPVACEDFLSELLDRGLLLRGIKHEGIDLPKEDFDRMVRMAASLMAARRVCASLQIKPEEERYRF